MAANQVLALVVMYKKTNKSGYLIVCCGCAITIVY